MRTCVRAVRRAPRPLGLLVPGRRVAAGRAGGRRGGARLRGDGADRSQRRLGLDGVRAGGRGRSGCGRSTAVEMAHSPAGRRAGWRTSPLLTRAHAHTLLVEDSARAGATCAGSSRARHVAIGTAHAAGEPPPAVPLETLARARRRPRLPERVRDHGVHDEPTLRRLLRRLRAGRSAGRAAAPLPAPRPRAQPRARRSSRARLGVPHGGDRQRPRARALARAAAGRVRRAAQPPTLDASEPVRRGNTAHVLATPQAMAARFEDHAEAVAETGELAERLRFDLTADLGYRYPGAEDPQALAQARRAVLGAARGALPGGLAAPRRRRTPGSSEELRVIDTLGLRRLLPAAPRPAGARARGRGGGARAVDRRARCCRRAAGAAPRCPRSSATSPASRTSTRSPTTCSSAASSTRSSTRCRTSTSTSRATCARC